MGEQENEVNKKEKSIIRTVLALICLIILLFLIIRSFGIIDNRFRINTNNLDIFDIIFGNNSGCNCGCTCDRDGTNHTLCECGSPDCPCNNGYYLTLTEETNVTKKSKKAYSKKSLEESKPNTGGQDVWVDSNEGRLDVWDEDGTRFAESSKLNIFKQASYHVFKDKIAPGSKNSYQFVMRNYNNFDLEYAITFKEENIHNINMQYRLKRNDKYIVGNDQEYVTVKELKAYNLVLPEDTYDSYTLEWKWIESDNDTEIGESVDASYGLTIRVSAERY